VVSDRRKALGVLKTLPAVSNPYVFGTGIHFFLRNTDDLSGVQKSLAAEGINDGRIDAIPPNLEDVYLSLLEGKGPDQ
jgi:hypothetical protein